MTDTGSAVAALTAAWLRALPLDRDTVVSGAGLWPLLGLLAGAADGRTREELAGAVGLDANAAADAAVALLAALDASPDIAAATGTWVRRGVPLAEWWRAHVPPESVGELTTQAALDAWAHDRTDGLIEKVPVSIGPGTALLIVSALLLRTTWQVPFTPYEHGTRTRLRRITDGLQDVHTVDGRDGAVTVVTVRGQQDVDVQLAVGTESAPAADVIDALLTGVPVAVGEQLLPGAPAAPDSPGVVFGTVAGSVPRTELSVPPFEVRQQHDLLQQAEVFGLRSAGADGGFPRLSPARLPVTDAAQEVLARFFATGFEAAAVTAVAMRASAVRHEVTSPKLTVTFDRPFGFTAIHRPTGVPVVAGWIADVG